MTGKEEDFETGIAIDEASNVYIAGISNNLDSDDDTTTDDDDDDDDNNNDSSPTDDDDDSGCGCGQ